MLKKPLNVISQNVARLEEKYPGPVPSILSNSVQEEEERTEINELNQRASSLEHVSEEDGQVLAKDGSSYNIATSDITAIPKVAKSPTVRKQKVPVLLLQASPEVVKQQTSRESLRQSIIRSSHQSKFSKMSST